MKNNIIYLTDDLNKNQMEKLLCAKELAVDTELTGLDVLSDKLCLVQIRDRDSDDYYLIQIRDEKDYPNLAAVLSNPNSVKIFHYARMDVLMIYKRLGIWATPVFCTKIGTLLARPKKGHALHNVLREVFNITMDGEESCSDWTKELTASQKKYAINDVAYLHILKDYLSDKLIDSNLMGAAKKCFDFIPTRCELDLNWGERDIFNYNPK